MTEIKKRSRAPVVVSLVILIIFMFLQIFPFYLSLVQSLQSKDFIPSNTLSLFPEHISFQNYVIAWRDSNLMLGFLWSLFYAGGYTAISVVIITVVAYVLSKKRFRGRTFMFLFFMSALMVPGEILLVSNYILVNELNLYHTPFAVLLPGLVNIFGIFLLRQFMHTVPDSILESAVLDGAGELRVILYIVLPLVMPAIATYSIITFIGQWNEYLWPQLVLAADSSFIPIQMRLLLYRPMINGSENHPYASTLKLAATMLTLIPVLIFYFTFQRFFTEGISISGLK